MNSRTLSSIDKCIEELTGYVSERISDSSINSEDLNEELTGLVYSISDLIRARVKTDKTKKAVTEVKIPEFLEQ